MEKSVKKDEGFLSGFGSLEGTYTGKVGFDEEARAMAAIKLVKSNEELSPAQRKEVVKRALSYSDPVLVSCINFFISTADTVVDNRVKRLGVSEEEFNEKVAGYMKAFGKFISAD